MPLRSCRHQLRLATWHDQPLRGQNVRQVAMALQAVQCAAVQRTVVQCTAVQCAAVQLAVQRAAVQCTAVQCAAVQCTAVQCAAFQCTAIHYAATLICIPLSLRRWNPRLLQEVTSRKVIFDVKRKKNMHSYYL